MNTFRSICNIILIYICAFVGKIINIKLLLMEFVLCARFSASLWVSCGWLVFCAVITFLYNKTNQMHQFPKFTTTWNSTCFGQFLCPSSGVYSLYTRHWYTRISYRFEDSFRAGLAGPARKLSSNLYYIHQCRVYSEYTPGDGQRNCPKHVEFHAGVNLGNWCIWLVLLWRNMLRCTVTWTENAVITSSGTPKGRNFQKSSLGYLGTTKKRNKGANSLRMLEHCICEFKSHFGYGCLSAYYLSSCCPT